MVCTKDPIVLSTEFYLFEPLTVYLAEGQGDTKFYCEHRSMIKKQFDLEEPMRLESDLQRLILRITSNMVPSEFDKMK